MIAVSVINEELDNHFYSLQVDQEKLGEDQEPTPSLALSFHGTCMAVLFEGFVIWDSENDGRWVEDARADLRETLVRALDYLQTRKEVDPERIGVTGRSGGGASCRWHGSVEQEGEAALAAVEPAAAETIVEIRRHGVARFALRPGAGGG